MQLRNGIVIHSPSDLVAFAACQHRTTLDLKRLLDNWTEPRDEADAALRIVQDYGDRHERDYLAALHARGLRLVEIDKDATLDERVEQTRKAMEDGADCIFQGALCNSPFIGFADFLVKVPGQSVFGDYYYEIADTKLARSNRAKFVIQLCMYAELLAEVQGCLPETLRVVLGSSISADGQGSDIGLHEEVLRTEDFIHYYRTLRDQYLEFVATRPATIAVPITACGQCHWRSHCTKHWEEIDHLSRVANIRSDHVTKLERAGIKTMTDLAALSATQDRPQTAINKEILDRLITQANLQLHPTDTDGTLRYVYRDLPVGEDDKPRGFALLPQPNEGDLYFDMEGFPYEPGGLEYLFGVGHWAHAPDGGKNWRFRAFWAHDRTEEKKAFEQFMDFVEAHLDKYPDAHIYHYASYEKTAITRLSGVHDTRAEFRDRLLREGRLVDLYRVVSSGLLLALPSYSIKKVERYYREKREQEISDAGESIVKYEAFRISRDPAEREVFLKQIEDYNFSDVESTQQLHDWLERIRPSSAARFVRAAPSDTTVNVENDPLDDFLNREKAAKDELVAWAGRKPEGDREWAIPVADLLGQLFGFYRRCKLPSAWRWYKRLGADFEELLEDPACLAMLEFTGETTQEKKSIRYWYIAPPQPCKLRAGMKVTCLEDGAGGSNFEFDEDTGRVSFTRRSTSPAPPKILTLVEGSGPSTDPKEKAVAEFINALTHTESDLDPVLGLLRRAEPRIDGRVSGGPVSGGTDPESVTATLLKMDRSHIVIQGPPGTGKTWTAARVIADLIRKGKRVAITANSHLALNQLLFKAWECLGDTNDQVGRRAALVKRPESDFPTGIDVINNTQLDSTNYCLAAGTSWLFCRQEQIDKWDYLFVDEASQVSLADIVAVGRCCSNIVLLGDQQQLPQPIEGVHPGYSGLSVLDYLMEGHATVPSSFGVFLPDTYRMHPSICRAISNGIYEGRLKSADKCQQQRLILSSDGDPALRPTGIVDVPVEHVANRQIAMAEVERIKDLYHSLLRQSWVNSEGVEQPISAEQILVVAPYNAQVVALKRALSPEARVGSVDKFQGQEGAVVILSMTVSDIDEVPRGFDFLFSLNRLNVAVSRAKCLALIVSSPALRTAECSSVNDMRMLSFYCALTQKQTETEPATK
jgi:predicted RecB family nuclease